MNDSTHRWDSTTKTIVVLALLVLLGLVVHRFRTIIPPLVISLLLAFVLAPIVDFFTNHVGLSRGLAATLVVLALIAGLLGLAATPMTIVPGIRRAVEATQEETTGIISDIGTFLSRPLVEVMGYSLDLSDLYAELSQMLSAFVSSVAQETVNIAITVASGAFWLIFITVTTFYLLKDADRIVEHLDRLPPPAYRDDLVRLREQVAGVWQAFLRGQLALSVAIAIITTVVCWAVGLPYAGALGLVAGVFESLPNIGPTLAAIPAVLLALFDGSRHLPLSNFWFAVLVAGLYALIQQVENNLLVPRILGRSLKLHPLLVLIGLVIGGNLGGILGLLLAAPVLATLRVIGHYTLCRLYDLDPFAESEGVAEPPRSDVLKRAHEAILSWTRRKREPNEQDTDSPGTGNG